MNSSSGCSPLLTASCAFLLSLLAATACTSSRTDGADTDADSAPLSGNDPTVDAGAHLPIATIPIDDSSGLQRYTDRTMDLNSLQVPKTGRDSASVALKSADARRAGPASIASDATIIDRAAVVGGPMLPLRGGRSGWVCVPDDPVTPVDDPVCLNSVAQRWASGVYMGKESFPHEGLGVGYKLRGGALASNTDPFLIRPLDGDSWIIEPPHVILVFQDTTGLGALPDDPGQGGPWVSWRGTPYAHVKVPIAP